MRKTRIPARSPDSSAKSKSKAVEHLGGILRGCFETFSFVKLHQQRLVYKYTLPTMPPINKAGKRPSLQDISRSLEPGGARACSRSGQGDWSHRTRWQRPREWSAALILGALIVRLGSAGRGPGAPLDSASGNESRTAATGAEAWGEGKQT